MSASKVYRGIYRSARISPCSRYRYSLYREILEPDYKCTEETAAFYLVNPSTADGLSDDHTVRKLYGFSRVLGVRKFYVVNVFAYRATHIEDLNVPDPVGPENYKAWNVAAIECDIHVIGWGRLNKLPVALQNEWMRGYNTLREWGRIPLCLGTNMDGTPKHPLMLGYETPFKPWGAA